MADTTTIEWVIAVARHQGKAARVWNPIRGCRPASAGCLNCWAAPVADMRANNPNPAIRGRHAGLTTRNADGKPVFNGTTRLVEGDLDVPLRTKRPAVWFVCSEGDLFGEGVEDEWRDQVFAVMALRPDHTFLVLTKRPERMRGYFGGIPEMPDEPAARDAIIEGSAQAIYHARTREDPSIWLAVHMPLPNVWLGVSVEDQDAANERIPPLLATPAALRFVSAEPLLGPVTIFGMDGPVDVPDGTPSPLHWVITGGESGPGGRPMHPDWARSLRDQCAVAGVPFFFKQWGEWAPIHTWLPGPGSQVAIMADGSPVPFDVAPQDVGGHRMACLGKRAAGHLLDGVEHREVPA